MVARMARSRLALGGAIAVVLVSALVALLVVAGGDGDGDGAQRVASAGGDASTTVATVTTSAPTTATTAPVASTTSSPPRPAATAPSVPAPTTGATSRPPGDRLTTTAGGHGPVQAALTQARQRWLSSRPARGYVWSYEKDCRCFPRQVEVTVDGTGSATAVRELDGTPSPQPIGAGLSVDAALAELQAAVDANAASISVLFDAALGLPSSYRIDRSAALADEEQGLTVITFTPRS